MTTTTNNKPVQPGSTAINIKEYFELPLEERGEFLRNYIETHNKVRESKKNTHTGKDLVEMADRNQETLITLFTQHTEMTKIFADMANITSNDEKYPELNLDSYVYTLQLMLEQNRMLILGMIAEYEGDLDTQLSTAEALYQSVGGND